jgi:hypothetical protein
MTDHYLSVPEAIELLKSIVIPIPEMEAASDSDLRELMRVADAVDVIYTAAGDELDRRPDENNEIPETLAP